MKKHLPLLGLSLVLFSRINFAQTYTAIPVTGFDQDVVAENSPAINYTTHALDNNNFVLYSATYGNMSGTNLGLPDNGSISNGNRTYQLQPYNQGNAMLLSTGETDSLKLLTPGHYSSVSLLGFATEGNGTLLVVLLFTDGSGTVNNLPVSDWFSSVNSIVISGFDRTDRTTDTPENWSNNPRMYAVDIPLSCADQQKELEKLLIINTTPSPDIRTCVFALSGTEVLTASATGTDITCNGLENGGATVTAAGSSFTDYTYSWNTVPPQTTTSISGLLAGSYVVTVTDTAGCTATDTVTVNEPAAIVGNQSFTLCAGESVTVGGNTYDSSGTYTDVLTAVNGCDSTVTTVLTVNSVNVNVSVTGLVVAALEPGAQYQWLDCDDGFSPVNGATGQSYTATANGHYAVQITQNGCTDTSACEAITTVSVAENAAALVLQAYPNPAADYVWLQAEQAVHTVEVFDITGKKQAVAYAAGKLDIRSLAPGMYWVRVTAYTGESASLRIVKR